MGAALGRPDKETWAIVGDGGFQMTLQELATAGGQDRIPVKVALMDNKKLGMIRQWQEIIYGGNYHSSNLPGPTGPEALPRPTACPAFRATAPDEVDDAIRAAQAVDGPALVWFEIAEEQNVFPMMPAGKGLSDLIENWGGAGRDGSHERPDGARRRGAGRPLRAGHRREPPPRPGRHRQQPARRPEPRREPDAGAQLQHRVAGRRPHREPGHQPHDHHAARRRLSPWSRWASSSTG